MLVGVPTNVSAEDGWFLPNPRKTRLPYLGTPAQAQEVRRVLEATIPGLKVMPDKTSRAILFEADPEVLKQLERVVKSGWIRSVGF